MALVIDVLCPWSGRRIRADANAWKHVVERHPELNVTGMEIDVARTISDPEFITDAGLPNRKLAYFRQAPFGFRQAELLKVVVRLERWGARLMSGHLVTAVKPNEAILWKRKS
jgi:hypothetical protein